MVIRVLASVLSIFVAWTVLDLLLHRYVLARMYQENAALWRQFNEMNIALIYFATFSLIAVFIFTYLLLISPKSLSAGLAFGAFMGLALGVSAGFGTYIHMPIPLSLAWGWFLGGWLKAPVAGAIVGLLITKSQAPLGG